uniref:Uncharacterized protein n=1 Tax=Nicotiana tabacum TaxID=4097 RepID=A0A1S4DBJ3_TOBAC|nr:PREDICTED: uncharacterized protein LOC107827874 [Nicotiana tabacum]
MRCGTLSAGVSTGGCQENRKYGQVGPRCEKHWAEYKHRVPRFYHFWTLQTRIKALLRGISRGFSSQIRVIPRPIHKARDYWSRDLHGLRFRYFRIRWFAGFRSFISSKIFEVAALTSTDLDSPSLSVSFIYIYCSTFLYGVSVFRTILFYKYSCTQ